MTTEIDAGGGCWGGAVPRPKTGDMQDTAPNCSNACDNGKLASVCKLSRIFDPLVWTIGGCVNADPLLVGPIESDCGVARGDANRQPELAEFGGGSTWHHSCDGGGLIASRGTHRSPGRWV